MTIKSKNVKSESAIKEETILELKAAQVTRGNDRYGSPEIGPDSGKRYDEQKVPDTGK